MTPADRIAEIAQRADAATKGPWDVWDGPQYVGGGADLCIGAGETWLANMNERHCNIGYGNHELPEGHSLDTDINICSFTDEITAEQSANAAFIAAARADVPALCSALKVACEALSRRACLLERDAALAEIARLMEAK
jgi:hypothetical protein